MKNQELLDIELTDKKEYVEIEIIRWWERKRILYNALLFGIEILVMLYYWQETVEFGISLSIFETLLVNFIANVFYTAGWTLELLFSYYLKRIMPSAFRKVFFSLGTLFSLALAFTAYYIALSPPF